jgi:hypothetical protein
VTIFTPNCHKCDPLNVFLLPVPCFVFVLY